MRSTTMMKSTTIAFIGGGNMSRSILGGLIADGCAPDRIWVSDPTPATLESLSGQFGVHTTADNQRAVREASVVVLAVKPQVMGAVAGELGGAVRDRKPLVVSIAAGVRLAQLQRWLGERVAIVRTMPNTPALVGSGASALYANPHVSDAQRQLAESILRAVGLAVWVEDESELDAVTALSGSGPAYFFLVMEAMETAAVDMGLPPADARLLTLQTAFGAAKMALESSESPAQLRARVTSPGGTTARGVAALRDGGLEALFARALEAAARRAQELGDELEQGQ